MRNKTVFFLIGLLATGGLLLFSSGCGNKREDRNLGSGATHGSVTVALSGYPNTDVTLNEHITGNFAADAMYNYALAKGYSVDFSLVNSGGLRANGLSGNIIPSGDWTDATVLAFLPFGNQATIVTISGTNLKEILERSVSRLDSASPSTGSSGRFLQASSQLKFVVSVAGTRQVVSCSTGTSCVVSTPGARVTSIKINNVDYNPSGTYTLITSDYITCATSPCQSGTSSNDGYVVFRKNNWEDQGKPAKINLGEDLGESVKSYLRSFSPVTPTLSGRITINP